MDPVVQAAIFTVCGTLALAVLGGFVKIVASTFTDKKGWKSVNANIGNTQRGSLSAQHEDLAKSISNGNSQIINKFEASSDKLFSEVKNMDTFLKVKEEREKHRYASLSESQKNIDTHIEGMKATFTELQRIQIENLILHKRVQELEYQLDTHPNPKRSHDLQR